MIHRHRRGTRKCESASNEPHDDAPESLKTEIVPFERDPFDSQRRQGREKEEEPFPSYLLVSLEQRTLRPRSANGNELPPSPPQQGDPSRRESKWKGGEEEGDLPG